MNNTPSPDLRWPLMHCGLRIDLVEDDARRGLDQQDFVFRFHVGQQLTALISGTLGGKRMQVAKILVARQETRRREVIGVARHRRTCRPSPLDRSFALLLAERQRKGHDRHAIERVVPLRELGGHGHANSADRACEVAPPEPDPPRVAVASRHWIAHRAGCGFGRSCSHAGRLRDGSVPALVACGSLPAGVWASSYGARGGRRRGPLSKVPQASRLR